MNKNKKIIDFHSHILPRADHGSKSTEISLQQLSILKEHGVDCVVATPHFYPFGASIEQFTEKIQWCTERLIKKAQSFEINIAIGAEVLVCEGMERMKGLEMLTIKGTNTLLLEMPFQPWSEQLIETVGKLSKLDFNIVLAHIDRYPLNEVERLLEFGLKTQLNASCFASIFTRSRYMKFLASGQVVALGSDLHGTDSKSVKNLINAYNKIGEKNADYIINSSSNLLDGAVFIR